MERGVDDSGLVAVCPDVAASLSHLLILIILIPTHSNRGLPALCPLDPQAQRVLTQRLCVPVQRREGGGGRGRGGGSRHRDRSLADNVCHALRPIISPTSQQPGNDGQQLTLRIIARRFASVSQLATTGVGDQVQNLRTELLASQLDFFPRKKNRELRSLAVRVRDGF